MLNFYAQLVAERHLADRLGDAVALHRIGGNNLSGLHVLIKFLIAVHNLAVYRKVILIFFDCKQDNLAARFLKLRRNHMMCIGNIHGKGYKCRRYVDLSVLLVVKSSGHTVFSADGRKAEPYLCIISAQQRGERCSPAFRILRHTFEVFLERETDLFVVSAVCHDFCN